MGRPAQSRSDSDDSDGESPPSELATHGAKPLPVVISTKHPNPLDASSEIEVPTPGEAPIGENAFDSEASRVLFDAIDQFQSCGAGAYIDIPQLIIVGGQSTGKSSLLQSLTDIPFPVGTDCCTRFATRIVSRRTAPGTPNKVKVTIVPSDFKNEYFDYVENESYKEYVQVKEFLTADEFSEIMSEVTTKYMCINPGKGNSKKNFAVEVLKVEISGPDRSQFSILDIPGIFSYDYNVNPGEMRGVQSMVIEYMRQPENIVICVADAMTDLSNQDAFKLAAKYVDKTRLIGVFTKCDLLTKAQANRVIAIADSKVDGVGQLLHHGGFVVRNRVDGDDEDPQFDLQNAEADLFSKPPWTKLSEKRRGSAMLKKYLGRVLCEKIIIAFPRLLDKLAGLLRDAEACKERLGESRTTHDSRRKYLDDIARKYESTARKALEKPWALDSIKARARHQVRDENDKFGVEMRELSHVYEFEDHGLKEDEYIQRLREVMLPDAVAAKGNQTPPRTSRRLPKRDQPIKSSEKLFAQIKEEVRICGSTELPGMVHPEVIHRLYKDQTENWGSMAEAHLQRVAAAVSNAAVEIMGIVFSPSDSTSVLHRELLLVLRHFHDDALKKAQGVLRVYCDGDRTKLLQTTDPGFKERLQLLQSLRMMKNVASACKLVNEWKSDHSVEHLGKLLVSSCHHSAEDNKVNEVHDVLKVYYEFSLQSFIRHITNTVIEDFVTDPNGSLNGFSTKYISGLSSEDVDLLGAESKDVVEERFELDSRIQTLRAADRTARTAMAKANSLG